MEQDKVREEVISVFKGVFKLAGTLTEEISAAEIREWDSLNHMVLIHRLEEKFGIKFDLFRLMELKNLGDFIRYISTELAHGDQGSKKW